MTLRRKPQMEAQMEPMKPMKPMEPMKPMKPMEPMKPMAPVESWWPEDLGGPSTTGEQNGIRYAFFPQRQRLLVEQDGKLTTYESGNHRISGVAQQQGNTTNLSFTSQNGIVNLDNLKKL